MTTPVINYLKDYQQPNYWVNTLELEFLIKSQLVQVTSRADYLQNKHQNTTNLRLDGTSRLISIAINEQILSPTEYILDANGIYLSNLPTEFSLTVVSELDPFNDKSCEGLYASAGNLFTQCEAQGFRKITFFQDRPDVMATYTTTIIANPTCYPILLSNGNLISEEVRADGLRKVIWQDPYKKPSYLFALVAGNFAKISDSFITLSGKEVLLEVYSEPSSINQCNYCLESLKRAMLWDQKRFNLEYDLERYMIVASGDFNMGAMENKGLNIFNTKYVLAEAQTASDSDFINVESVVGHEYFHNWTGNRVTCRDWFQLSLKEGLTVFRDQEFSADLHSRAVQRIKDVSNLRQTQFSEDDSPLAHPIRPASYLEINNFYTSTVYEKGAEVVRMYQTLFGQSGFAVGLKLYFDRHDGQAATCEDFCRAMADANNSDLTQFLHWYSQAGTPKLQIQDKYDAANGCYTLDITQALPNLANYANDEVAQALLIPLQVGFLNDDGQEIMPELLSGKSLLSDGNLVLLVDQWHNKFEFKLNQAVTPSLLRNFSAPVILDYSYTETQLINLARNDNDSFNQWEALQTLYRRAVYQIYAHKNLEPEHELMQGIANALKTVLAAELLDPHLKALFAKIPSVNELGLALKPVKIHQLCAAVSKLEQYLATQLETEWLSIYHANQTTAYTLTNANQRALKNCALGYLLASSLWQNYLTLAEQQYLAADNMTDRIGVLLAINNRECTLRAELLDKFSATYSAYPLVLDKWFTLHALSQNPQRVVIIRELLQHRLFDGFNPNKLYSLIRAFSNNASQFNTADGYTLVADEILRVDQFNPGVASRLAHGFSKLSGLSAEYQHQARPQLQRILDNPQLSTDVYELVSKTMAQLANSDC